MSVDRVVPNLVAKTVAVKDTLSCQTANTKFLSVSGHLSISADATVDGFNGRDFQFNDVKLNNLYVTTHVESSGVTCATLKVTDTLHAAAIRTAQMDMDSATIHSLLSQVGSFRTLTVPDLTATNIIAANVSSSNVDTNKLTSIDGVFSNSIQLGSTTLVSNNAKPIVCKMPNIDTHAEFLVSEGNQTIHGVKTFRDPTIFDNAVLLPTRGGVPSSLDFYEYKQIGLTFKSDAFESDATLTVLLCRLGQLVTCVFGSFAVQGSGHPDIVTSNEWIPRQFRPPNVETTSIVILDGDKLAHGRIFVKANGIVEYGCVKLTGVFNQTGQISGKGIQGFERASMSWIVLL